MILLIRERIKEMDKNIIRYDKEEDILYILIADGEVKDTVEIGDDVFIEIGQKEQILGIEIWQARKKIFSELFTSLEEAKAS